MEVEYYFENGIAEIRLNRPEKRNALSRELIEAISAAIKRASGQTGNRLTLITANGPAFCAGMDLAEMQQRAAAANADELFDQDSQAYRNMLVAILDLKMPTVAALQGPAVAGGLGIVLACDLVVMHEKAFLALPEPKRGIVAAMVMPLLVYRTGVGAANHVLLSGQRVTSEEALRMNLCHRVASPDEYRTKLHEYCQTILTGAPQALALTKKHLAHCSQMDVVKLIDQSIAVSAFSRESSEAREGLAAFLEKRDPRW